MRKPLMAIVAIALSGCVSTVDPDPKIAAHEKVTTASVPPPVTQSNATRNQDELAFILGHEVAHHISGHIPKARDSAVEGAVISGLRAAALGAGADDIKKAQSAGGTVAARKFSKGFELEADALGTIITAHAGYDPLIGAKYFNRIPDPGNRYLGSHPPNRQRIAIVHRTVANM